ncbi:dynein light intermediate chain 2, cytosolic [Angomonas deanei]|nr:dynein light intermediate chain 2, cytosolic [Angomonas deanei]|eukprot:EPY30061.1 dynein light intermediate chain 2, cytosolic [Angomonas deanei]
MLADIIINPENIHALVFAVVVDVSSEYNPGNNTSGLSGPKPVSNVVSAWDTAVYWLRRMDERVDEIFNKMRAKHSKTPEKLLARALKIIGGEENPDYKNAGKSNKMRLSGIPTILVVNKMNLFAENTAKLKLLTKSFRYLAHLYGAHIIFTSENNTAAWKHLISHILFQSPFDPKYIEFDCERGEVLLTADKDSFVAIGEPDYAGGSTSNSHASSGDADLDKWRGPLENAFPPPDNAEEILKNSHQTTSSASNKENFIRRLYSTSGDGYGEPIIDALRKQKDEELEQYRKANKSKSKK